MMLPTIKSYLKLYTTMPLDEMAGVMEMPAEEFRKHLLAFKHKMKNVVWTLLDWKENSRLDPRLMSTLTKITIHVADTKVFSLCQ